MLHNISDEGAGRPPTTATSTTRADAADGVDGSAQVDDMNWSTLKINQYRVDWSTIKITQGPNGMGCSYD